MIIRNIIAATLLSLLPFSISAQTKKTGHKTTKKVTQTKAPVKAVAPEDAKPVKTFKDPTWSPRGYHSQYHVYFPDYEMFYDPHRGYVYREKGSWVASPSMPLYLSNKDLSKERVQILEDLSLDLRPEESYPRYMKMYPANPNNKVILAPVPSSTGGPGRP